MTSKKKLINLKKNIDFEDLLKKKTKEYNGKLSETIKYASDIYNLMCNLLTSEKLTKKERNKISCVIGYFILPKDVFPEEVFGMEGYIDDIYLCLYILKEIEKKHKIKLLLEYWDRDNETIERLLTEDYEMLDKNFSHILNDMLYYIGLK